jgi:hypothetical protein
LTFFLSADGEKKSYTSFMLSLFRSTLRSSRQKVTSLHHAVREFTTTLHDILNPAVSLIDKNSCVLAASERMVDEKVDSLFVTRFDQVCV